MASLIKESKGSMRIDVVCPDSVRRKIRLGKPSKQDAETFKRFIERIVRARRIGEPPDEATTRWLQTLPDNIHAKIAAVGLVRDREICQLGPWLEGCMKAKLDGLKPESARKLRQTISKLVSHFGERRDLRQITPDDAQAWRQMLVDQRLSNAAVKTHAGNAKTFFNEAVRRKMIPESPFAALKSGATPSTNERYITPEETRKILDACPDARWRLLVGLARYAGLRIPSESYSLRWRDVLLEQHRLDVRSPKTERYRGHERRTVPIDPRLYKLVLDRFDELEPGEDRLLKMRGGRIRLVMNEVVRRSGVVPWTKFFQTLRASCEKEWAMHHPQAAVSQWIGHSLTTSGKHYLNGTLPDELYDKAAGLTSGSAAQNPAQYSAESARKASQSEKPTNVGDSQNVAPDSELVQVLAGQGIGASGTPVKLFLAGIGSWRPNLGVCVNTALRWHRQALL
jgi:integrase